MIRFSGIERFPFLRILVAQHLANAAFLAQCAPQADIQSADNTTALWIAPSPFRALPATVTTLLTINTQSMDRVDFTLSNQLPGASLAVNGTFEFTDGDPGGTAGETCVRWSAEIVSRTGLLKVVPPSVLHTQIERELEQLWRGVHKNLAALGSAQSG